MSGKSRGRYRSVGSHRDGSARAAAGIEGRRIRDETVGGESGEDHENFTRSPWTKGRRFDERSVHCLLLNAIRMKKAKEERQT